MSEARETPIAAPAVDHREYAKARMDVEVAVECLGDALDRMFQSAGRGG